MSCALLYSMIINSVSGAIMNAADILQASPGNEDAMFVMDLWVIIVVCLISMLYTAGITYLIIRYFEKKKI